MITAKAFKEYLGITIGVFLTALGLDLFLIPLKIAAGGVSGIGTILYYLTGFPVGMTMLAMNIPLFLFSVKELGVAFGIRSLYGMVLISFAVDLLAHIVKVPTHELLLASIYGGVLTGIGVGITFRSKGTTGGTDLAASLVHKWTGLPIGQCLMFIDAGVIMAAGLVFSAEAALYALITVFVTSKMIDIVQEGLSYAKAALIISNKYEEIGQAILGEMDRGATSLFGKGLYTGANREVLLSVVSQSEVTKLKELVYNVDPDAFVILTDVHEVLGEGFRRIK